MYSSIMKTKPRPGDWIAILGAGGGLGHMCVEIHDVQTNHKCRADLKTTGVSR
jgi:D-arabinose 1-dehydrogenase-like Zn-dependent alcohol dehydrogenase